MDIALGSVMDGAGASHEGVHANRDAARAMFVSTVAMFGLLLVTPEPITNVLAAMMTAALDLANVKPRDFE